MLCRNCGNQIPDGLRFCTECGAPIGEAPVQGYAAPYNAQPVAPLGASPVAQSGSLQAFQPSAQDSTQSVAQPRKSLPTAAIIGIIAVIAVIAIAVIVAVALFAPIGNSGTEPASTEQPAAQQQTAPEEAIQQAPESPASPKAPAFTGFTAASASSTLLTEGINYESYAAANLLDGNPATCWSEGVDGQGQGESVQFSAPGAQTISGFDIWNGFQESDYLYSRNCRPAAFNVFADGDFVQTVNLADSGLGSQRITFVEPVQASTITLEITSVYAGSAHADCCISEVAFF